MDRPLSDDELKGRTKAFALIVLERPQFVIDALEEFLKEEDIGVNLYWKRMGYTGGGKHASDERERTRVHQAFLEHTQGKPPKRNP